MKVVVIGASGTIGKAVVQELSGRHELIKVGNSSGDYRVDITSEESIRALYESIGSFDALVSCTGKIHFGPLDKMTPSLYQIGLQSKLMGQINLVLIGLKYIKDRGSFTLTSGVLDVDPIFAGSSASMVNAAIDGFVRGAAIEMPRGIRINSVSPTVILESMPKYESYFRGFNPVPVKQAALAYSKSVEGLQTGKTYRVG